MAGRATAQLLAGLLALALVAPAAVCAAAPNQAKVLLEFADAARGDNTVALADWHAGTDPCAWTGVECSGDRAVTALRLPRAGLRGTLDPVLAQLTTLQQIDLKGNELTGRLPARWARLAALERLALDANALTGPLPPAWNTLEGLQYLSLARNRLNGSLPVAWASLGQLYSLDLSGNGLVGPLPAAWARQRGLVRLALGRNALSGGLPREWGRLRSLLQLDLAGNALSGGLPPEWGDLAQVSAVDLSANRLEGALPPAWGRMATLQVLALQGNQLSGAVPPRWSQLADRAFRISLGDNPRLCGTVPQPLAQAVMVAGASARGSSLAQPCSWEGDAAALLAFKAQVLAAPTGALADWLPDASPCSEAAWSGVGCRDGRVAVLNLANAGLRLGSLEPLAGLDALQVLLLRGNSAPGAALPDSWARLQRLSSLDLSGTGVGGGLPPAWVHLSSLSQVLLGDNALNGTLPASWAVLGSLAELDLSNNGFTGPLPPEWAALGSLARLDASGNYLSGGLPDPWHALAGLRELQLASNNLGGPIPSSWARLPSLTLLDLGSNVGVCGSSPTWPASTQVHTDATNMGQSCIMVQTSGTVAGVVLGVSLSMTLASLAAAGAMLVYVRRQRAQLMVLQRERSAASFSSFQQANPSFDGGSASFAAKLATLNTFSAAGGRPGAKAALGVSIPAPWGEDQGGACIQVPLQTPHSALALGPAHTPARFPPTSEEEEHRSPSPRPGMPSPDRHQWQVAAQAADRGMELTARSARQKRLFRSRSDAPVSLVAVADQQAPAAALHLGAERSQSQTEVDIQRAHSRVQLLPPDRDSGAMV